MEGGLLLTALWSVSVGALRKEGKREGGREGGREGWREGCCSLPCGQSLWGR